MLHTLLCFIMVYVEATTDLQKDFIPFLFFLGKNEICCNFSNPFMHGELIQQRQVVGQGGLPTLHFLINEKQVFSNTQLRSCVVVSQLLLMVT